MSESVTYLRKLASYPANVAGKERLEACANEVEKLERDTEKRIFELFKDLISKLLESAMAREEKIIVALKDEQLKLVQAEKDNTAIVQKKLDDQTAATATLQKKLDDLTAAGHVKDDADVAAEQAEATRLGIDAAGNPV